MKHNRGFGHIIFTLSFMSNPNFKQGDQEEAQQKSSNFITDSGIPIAHVTPPLPPDFEPPGEFPFTRGIHPSMFTANYGLCGNIARIFDRRRK